MTPSSVFPRRVRRTPHTALIAVASRPRPAAPARSGAEAARESRRRRGGACGRLLSGSLRLAEADAGGRGHGPGPLDEAVQFAIANENPASKDLALDLATTFGAREPFDTPIGPVKERGAANGLIVRHGYIVAEWGDTARVDMTFSVTKTFLSTVVGLAWQKGLIRDVTDLARDYMPVPGYFDGHNATITWEHLLRQTSDWQGTLWGKPDWADRPEGATPADWPNRTAVRTRARATSTTIRA